jgi:HlyD family secretion protein
VSRKSLWIAAVPCVLALAFALIRPAWLAAAPTNQDRSEATAPPASGGFSVSFGSASPAVDTQQPTHGKISETVSAPATIKSGGEVAVCAPFDGRVVELCFDEGDAVLQSQVIFRLDPIEYDDKAREAELDLARKKAALLESDAELKEAEHKWEELKTEPSALTEARLKIRQSELSRERSQADLENTDAKLARMRDRYAQNLVSEDDVKSAEAEQRSQSFALRIAAGELDLAKKTLSFQQRQWETDKATAEKALDTAVTHVNRGKADLVASEVALYRARRDRGRCDVRTPIAGIITRRNVNEGELTSRPLAADQPQYIVSDMAHMLAYADVDEGDVVKCEPGQQARVRVNALGDDVKLAGKVIDVANRAFQKANEDTKSFRVRILLSPKDDRLRPDMSANVEIETRSSAPDALRVPMQAVLHKAKKDILGDAAGEPVPSAAANEKKHEEQKDWVFVVEGDKAVARLVTLGVQDGELVEVKSGLVDTDWVVLGPYRALDALKSGDAVKATRKEAPKPDASIAAATSRSAPGGQPAPAPPSGSGKPARGSE